MQENNSEDIADLLADESFINYCMHSSPEDTAFWENYSQQSPARRELVELARERFLLLFTVLGESDREEQATRLKNKLNQKEAAPVVKMDERGAALPPKKIALRFKFAGAVAVMMLAVFAVQHYWVPEKNKPVRTFITSFGERKNVQLPDGSVVNLNVGSRIKIDGSFGLSARNVYLEGEAFFDVKHNEKIPFIVHTATMDIKALGTAFDVKAYGDDRITETSLIRGLVEVTLKEKDNQVLLLHPNQKVAWHNSATRTINKIPGAAGNNSFSIPDGIPEKVRINDHGDIKEIAWKENKLVLEDDVFSDVAMLLERWYGVHIEFEDESIKGYRFSGVFEKEDLQTVLAFLKESRSFNFKIEPGETIKVSLSR